MSAITTSPAFISAGGSTSGSFGAASVTVTVASIESPIRSDVSALMPEGMSIGHDRHAGFVDVGDDRLVETGQRRGQAGAEHRVDDQIVAGDLGAVQLPRGFVGDFDDGLADAAENFEIDPRVAFDFGETADDEHRHVEAALLQRARHDEAVAAVVALAADDGDAAIGEIGIEGFDRGHHLAAGVLHQHQRGDADVLDRAAIGFAHLLGVQDPHAYASIGGQMQIRLRSPYGLSMRPTLGQNLLARTHGSG